MTTTAAAAAALAVAQAATDLAPATDDALKGVVDDTMKAAAEAVETVDRAAETDSVDTGALLLTAKNAAENASRCAAAVSSAAAAAAAAEAAAASSAVEVVTGERPTTAVPAAARSRKRTRAAQREEDERTGAGAGAGTAASEPGVVFVVKKRGRGDGAALASVLDPDDVLHLNDAPPAWLPDDFLQDLEYRVLTLTDTNDTSFFKAQKFDLPRAPDFEVDTMQNVYANEVTVSCLIRDKLLDTGASPHWSRVTNYHTWESAQRFPDKNTGVLVISTALVPGVISSAFLDDCAVRFPAKFDAVFRSVATQLLLALETAQKKIVFVHNDLWADNVMVGRAPFCKTLRVDDDDDSTTTYDYDYVEYVRPNGQKVYLPTTDVAESFVTIIDPAYSHAEVNNRTLLYPSLDHKQRAGIRCGESRHFFDFDSKFDAKTFFNSIRDVNYSCSADKAPAHDRDCTTLVDAFLARYPHLTKGTKAPAALLEYIGVTTSVPEGANVLRIADATQ